jgi:hypothetical protein
MTEELLRKICAMRAVKLNLNGAQRWVFSEKTLQLWTEGKQIETALQEAAKEVRQ